MRSTIFMPTLCLALLPTLLPAQGTTALEAPEWRLAALNGDPVSASDPQTLPYLRFDPGSKRVAGLGGCNRISSSYEVHGEELKLGGFISTMMACEEPRMKIEQAFLKALAKVKAWKIGNAGLELLDNSGACLALLVPRK